MGGLALLIIIIGPSWAQSFGNWGATGFKTCTVVLLDSSGSASSTQLRKRFEREAKDVLSKADQDHLMALDFIQSSSESESMFPIQMELPGKSLLRNTLEVEKEIKSKKEKGVKELGELLTRYPKSNQTDIVGAVRSAAKVFNGNKCAQATRKELIIFSDMVNESIELNLNRVGSGFFRRDNIARYVGSFQNHPALEGVIVWVSGAGSSVSRPANAALFRQLQDFWIAFFERCGASLTDSRYAATLLNYP